LTLSIVGIGLARWGGWRTPTRWLFTSLLLGPALAGMSREFYLRLSDPRPAAERRLTENRSFTKDEAHAKYEDWLRVCRWVKTSTPANARFLTPQFQQSFKWRAERSEVVNWKDVPQDAASIVAWRRQFFAVYPREVRLGGIMKHTDRRLNELAREYDAQFLIVDRSQGVRPTKLLRLYPLANEPEGYYEVFRLATGN
jgi:hypothetical protein